MVCITRYKTYLRAKKRGEVTIFVGSQIQQVLKKVYLAKKCLMDPGLRAGVIQCNKFFHMSDVEKCLVYSLIRKREDGLYEITEDGERCYDDLLWAQKADGKTINWDVNVSEEWLEYFRNRVW